jgi:penicillin V acylase-like amidase (Ntn superfamily)
MQPFYAYLGLLLVRGGRLMKKLTALILLIALGLFLPQAVFPCSSFAFMNKGHLVFGTNYDNSFWPGFLFINRKNIKKSSWEPGTSGQYASWVAKYGSVTITCVGYQLPWAGMNEAGLVFSTMALSEKKNPNPDERPPLTSPYWWRYMLDTCATVKEVLAAEKHVRMAETEDHYFVCDRTGDCATIEFLDGRMVVYRGNSLPVRALANAPYAVCLDHWNRRTTPSKDSYNSVNRFSRLAGMMSQFKEGERDAAYEYAFKMLKDVVASDTRWSLVFDTGNLTFHFHTFQNPSVRSIDLKKTDFSCDTPAKMLDAHASLSGDITGSFKDYSHEISLNHLLKSIKNFRPDISEERIRQLLLLIESFPCESAKK